MIKAIRQFIQGQSNYLLIIIIAVTIISLSPMLISGYYGDDSFLTLIKGTLKYYHMGLFEYTLYNIQYWASVGCLRPFEQYFFILHFFIENIFLYKSFIIASVVINMLLFYYLVKRITHSTPISHMSLVLLSLLFQFRLYNDPILSYYMLMQLLFFYLLILLIFLLFYLEKGKITHLLISLSMLFISLFTYELTVLYFIFVFAFSYLYYKENKLIKSLKISLPYIILTVLYILCVIFVRLNGDVGLVNAYNTDANPDPYTPNPDPISYINTLGKQIFAAFPLNYFIFQLSGHISSILNASSALINIKSLSLYVIIALITSVICFIIITLYYSLFLINIKNQRIVLENWKNNRRSLIIFGLMLVVLPNLIHPLSSKYQIELEWGVGYLPVYISYFGVSLLIVVLIIELFNKINKWSDKYVLLSVFFIAIVLSTVFTINFIDNTFVVLKQNEAWQYPRELMEDGISNGLMDNIPNGTILIMDTYRLWDRPDFYILHSGKMVEAVSVNGSNLNIKILPGGALENFNGYSYTYTFSESDPVYYLKYETSSSHRGYSILSHINKMICTNTTISELYSDNILVYVQNIRLTDFNGDKMIKLSGTWMDTGSLYPFSINGTKMNTISSSDNWKIYCFNSGNKRFDLNKLTIQY